MLFLVRNCPFVRQIAIQLHRRETSVVVYFLCKLVHVKSLGSFDRKVGEKRVFTAVPVLRIHIFLKLEKRYKSYSLLCKSGKENCKDRQL